MEKLFDGEYKLMEILWQTWVRSTPPGWWSCAPSGWGGTRAPPIPSCAA